MAKADPQGLATKTDIGNLSTDLRNEIKDLRREMHVEIKDLRREMHEDFATKKEMNERFDIVDRQFDKVFEYFVQFKKELVHEFNVIAENWYGDIAGANRDEREQMKNKIDNHERRIRVLEGHIGIVPA